ncbi:uncharacterized protein LOC109809002 isoform X2 [Cajanus cajan]|uniref:uncharacterized protein LOC109809002 isoform X2 n=1 Tax=Cajanus cajan TaxID=3821 RepID=UPI00098DAB6F|nr:uncharacterized protein LOC109809002 isoform X2 [Cajanus cajan]
MNSTMATSLIPSLTILPSHPPFSFSPSMLNAQRPTFLKSLCANPSPPSSPPTYATRPQRLTSFLFKAFTFLIVGSSVGQRKHLIFSRVVLISNAFVCMIVCVMAVLRASKSLRPILSVSEMRVDDVFDSDCAIELFTPKLQSFSYCDSHLYNFSAKVSLSQVEKVDIVINCLTKDTNLSLRLIGLFEGMGSAKFVSLSLDVTKVLSMFRDLLNGRSSPFTRVVSFKLNMGRPASSYVIHSIVMAYLFSGSPEMGSCLE